LLISYNIVYFLTLIISLKTRQISFLIYSKMNSSMHHYQIL